MDKPLSEILNAIPAKPPRSKLEPHYELIRELRRRSKTYREIAKILEDHVGLCVDHSTIYDFVHVRGRRAKTVRHLEELPPRPVADGIAPPESDGGSSASLTKSNGSGRTLDPYARIDALKRRKPISKPVDQGFHYEEEAPLRLISEPVRKA
jgi:hypothetical protein